MFKAFFINHQAYPKQQDYQQGIALPMETELCPHQKSNILGKMNADSREEGLSYNSFRPHSAMMKVLLSNKLKCVERCQTLLVGENEIKKKNQRTLEKGNIQQLESHTSDKQISCIEHLLFLQLFIAQLSKHRQTSYPQPLQNIPKSKSFTSLSNYPSSPIIDFCEFIFMCWRGIC